MRKIHSVLAFLLSVLLVAGMTACKPVVEEEEAPPPDQPAVQQEEDEPEPYIETVSSESLALEIAERYAQNEAYEYLPAIPSVERDHRFEFVMGFDPFDQGFEKTTEIVNVFADPEFTISLYAYMDIEERDDGNTNAFVGPGRSTNMAVFNEINSTKAVLDRVTDNPDDRYYVDYKGEFSDWGNLPRYYMVQYIDMETGEALEKPIVQVFEVKAELDAPKVEFFVDEYGLASFRWDPVEGAERYIVVETSYYPDEENRRLSYDTASVISLLDGSETEWHAESNGRFTTGENVNEIGYIDESWEDWIQGDVLQHRYSNSFGVIALGNGGHSSVGKLFNDRELSSVLPYSIAHETRRAGGDTKYTIDEVNQLPAQIPIVMCDGMIVNRTINYNYNAAKVVNETWLEYDEGPPPEYEMLNPRNITVTLLKIDWTLPNTPFKGYYNVMDPPDSWKEELAKIRDRQNEMTRGSGTGNKISFRERESEGKEEGVDVTVLTDTVFATNALSEYLATCMLSGMATIPLDPFPVSSDTEYLLDAFFEAYYQNPLILGVDELALSDKNELLVLYQDNNKTRREKQEAIRNKVVEVTKEIIKDDMSSLEKQYAINQYLCDNAEYDYAALENAANYDYMYVDPEFNDSFTPYGILINGVGVCASYAGAFKMLADAAGLESIVTTGKLEGLVSHAWNRVKLGDEWMTIDVTNNDNPYFFNALLNLPDDASAMVLVEDTEFILDEFLPLYTGASSYDSEYYRVQNDYYEKSEMGKKLAEGLKTNGFVCLRTDYDLDDEGFYEILFDVADEIGTTDFSGGYWLGVVTLAK